MQEIADWLKSLGMSEYAQRFAENDIDFTILSDLTDQDLEKIGVASLGHRRKLLRAMLQRHVGYGFTCPGSRVCATVHCGHHFSAACRTCWRAPACHGDVLRSCGFDRHSIAARC